jgi:preprotein translocase SecE subunit
MADQDANNTAAGATGGTNGAVVPVNPAPVPTPKGGPAIEGTATTGQPPAGQDSAASQPDAGIFWDVFWPALILAVFIWMWRTGKVTAIRNYILETKEQLDKCTWPTWNELKQHIVVVLISSFLLALFTVIADNIVKEIVWGALLGSDTLLFTPPPPPGS